MLLSRRRELRRIVVTLAAFAVLALPAAKAEEQNAKKEPAPVVIDPAKPSPEILKHRPPGGLIFLTANLPAAKGLALVNRHTLIAIDPQTGKWTTVLDPGTLRQSISPDGQTVVYELGKTLWSRSVVGGEEPKKILDLAGPGNGGAPVWSGDSKRIIVSLGDRDPVEQRLVYLHLQLNADGTEVTELPLPKNFVVNDWSPEGRKIVGVFILNGAPARGRLSVVQLDGRDLSAITDDAAAPAIPRAPRFSPNGSRFAYCDNAGTWVVDSDGKNRRKVWSADGRNAGFPCWSPDGLRFAIVTRTPNTQGDLLYYTLEILALDDLHRVARFELPAGNVGGYTYWR